MKGWVISLLSFLLCLPLLGMKEGCNFEGSDEEWVDNSYAKYDEKEIKARVVNELFGYGDYFYNLRDDERFVYSCAETAIYDTKHEQIIIHVNMPSDVIEKLFEKKIKKAKKLSYKFVECDEYWEGDTKFMGQELACSYIIKI